MSISTSGAAGGHLVLQANDALPGDDILPFRPDIQSTLDEIVKKGWKYIFVETRATATAELDLPWCNYSIKNAHPDDPAPEVRDSPENVLELEVGALPLRITGIQKVQAFRVSVTSKSIPRAVTVDLASQTVTDIGDQFWKWEQGWESDQDRVSEGLEIYEVIRWLVDEKGFRLAEKISLERYRELSKVLGDLLKAGQSSPGSAA